MRSKGEFCGISVEWEPVRKIARVTWRGDVSLSALRARSEAFRRWPEIDRLHGIIVDFTRTGEVNLTSYDLLTFSEDIPVFPPAFPRVMVAEQDLHYGLLRMYENLAAERRTGTTVVRTMQEAYALFKLDEPVFVPLPPS